MVMPQIPLSGEQLHWIVQIANSRTPFLDHIFRFLNYFDTVYFNFFLLGFVWIGFSYRWGIRFFYLLVVNYMTNHFFKEVFQWPRPTQDMPGIGLYDNPSYGFPSGGAQTAMLFGLILLFHWKNKYCWLIVVSYVLLLSYSRLYLGVHYPIDILGGWILGALLFYLFQKLDPPLEKHLQSKGLLYSFIVSQLIPILLFLITQNPIYHRFDMMVAGLFIVLSFKYHLYLPPPKKIWHGLVRGAITVVGFFAIYFGSKPYLPVSLYIALMIGWVSLLVSPIIRLAFSHLSVRKFP